MTRRIFCTIALGMVAGCMSLEERLASQDPAVRADAVASIDKESELAALIDASTMTKGGDEIPRWSTDVRLAAYEKCKIKYMRELALENFFPKSIMRRENGKLVVMKETVARYTADARLAVSNSTQVEIANMLRKSYESSRHINRALLWKNLSDMQIKCNLAAEIVSRAVDKGAIIPKGIDREIVKVLIDPENEEYANKAFAALKHPPKLLSELAFYKAFAERFDHITRLPDCDKELESDLERLLNIKYFRGQVPRAIGEFVAKFKHGNLRNKNDRSAWIAMFTKWVCPMMNEKETMQLADTLAKNGFKDVVGDILAVVDWTKSTPIAKILLYSISEEDVESFLADKASDTCPDDIWMEKACELESVHFKDRDAISRFFARMVKTLPEDKTLPIKPAFALTCLLLNLEWVCEYKSRLLDVLSDEQLEQFALRNDFDDAAIARMKSHVRILAIMTRISDLKSRSARFGKLVSLTTGEKKEFLIASKQALDAEIKRIEDEKAAQLEKERRLAEERARKAEEERHRREAEEDATYERELAQAKGKTLVIKGYFLGMDANVARRKWAKELGGNAEIRSIGNKVTEFRFSKADLGVLLGYGNLYPEEFCKRLLEDFNLPSFDSRVVRESCEELFKRADMLNASYYDIAPRNYISQQIYTHASKNGFRVTYYTDDISFFGHKTMPGQEDIDADYSAAMTRAWGMSNAGILQAGKEHGVRKRLIEEMGRACIRFMEEKGAAPGTLVIQQL